MKKVGIILVGYKDYVNRFLDECRESLRAQNYPKEFYQVYIIDNCSINDCEYVKKNYPEAKCVARPDGNYAAANNLGIKMARQDGCEYFVIANMDVKFDPNWLSELVKAVESENPPRPSPRCSYGEAGLYQGGDKIGIAQSKILKYPQSDKERKNPRINSLGNIIHFLGFGFTDGYGEVDNPPSPLYQGGDIGYASGCSLIIKKEVIDKIGGYDEEYYMYHDDLEFGWKARLAGYKIVLAPESRVYHKYEFKRSVKMFYYMERNRYLAMLHYYHWATLLLILPAIIVMEIGMVFYSILGGRFMAKMKASAYFLNHSNITKIIKKRNEVRKLKKINENEIVKSFQGKVLFQEISNPVLKYLANPVFNIYWSMVKILIFW